MLQKRVTRGYNWLKLSCQQQRQYHDESFGFRKRPAFEFPDYDSAQIENRHHNAALLRYVDNVRTHAHRAARIDPLDLIDRESEVAALDPSRYGLTDGQKKYNVNGIIWTNPRVESQRDDTEEWWTLDQITRHLKSVYVGRIAYEYMHSPSKTERLWFSHLLESKALPVALAGEDRELKKRIHGLLSRSEVFDNFLQLKFPNLKRYALEGGESMLPALDSLFASAARSAVSHIIVAMPHRGRLNFLTDLLNYSPTALFHKIRGGFEFPEELGAEGDVISHLVSSTHLTYSGAHDPVKVSLLPNPSHLEAVNAVALGKTRAKQYSLLKTSPDTCQLGDKVMCVQLHGDASFSGQGVVMETLGLSNLPHFTSGGTVHLVVDIGYTTPASQARSSLYCSDVGKMIGAPVLHVNGDHPEDVVRAMEVAFKYRQYFRKDIIVDLLVYRRWGHNELDIPSLTSPLMYEKIQARKSVPQLYEQKLIAEEILTEQDVTNVRSTYKASLEKALSDVPSYQPSAPMLQEQWSGMVWPGDKDALGDPVTGVERDTLMGVGKASVMVPEGFEIHSKLLRHVKNRLQSIDSGKGLDWATTEAMAFGTLLSDGIDVRISGQDVGRGTFSQRHAMLVDQKSESVFVPLNDQLMAQGKLELANSSLSEMGVLGFEYGASWERPNLLPIWEAQFGDFFNGAQIIIDTFVSSAETKWLKQSGIVLLLPHGLDGAGPEHSSSRLERMLQLTNDRYTYSYGEDSHFNINMHVVFPTTPAQYFHLLRRQMKRNYRKPLIVAAPKGLLRLSAAASSLSDLEFGTKFRPVLDDPIGNQSTAKRVVVLSGKIYYDLVKERQAQNVNDNVAFVRLEELAPFPFHALHEVLDGYSNASEFVYLQEEPRNQGAWPHVKERLELVLKQLGRSGAVEYKGRKESALPAPGVGKLYKQQQEAVIKSAFEGL
ncbi:putative 2-oxoglutarate dehydrogenase e1 component mitochondrial [Moniliophthora roreri MCA 2997]|uniref:2-oxoglutarate dehydrogenase e1 component mitochondrial n=1 Tax=Moniliophthora roreri (strain MCA 2997) TaxID=1381753 RepID=V2XGK9_MONRO|nr:putative 2-oxoglutarate dehydrogenase e1 component mitochondrial [Moniliophthora roreri MCA 2997]